MIVEIYQISRFVEMQKAVRSPDLYQEIKRVKSKF